VAYRPVVDGMQVCLEREGPVQLSGPGHQGRMEIALRTIFGKIFAKERRIPLVPEGMASNPRLADLRAVQAVATDGWLAIALAPTTTAGASAAPATATGAPAQRLLRRR
jgi:predicted amino acid dehydrogenase